MGSSARGVTSAEVIGPKLLRVRPCVYGLEIPGHAAVFRIFSKSHLQLPHALPIFSSPDDPLRFYAVFEEDDVDFYLSVQNMKSEDLQLKMGFRFREEKLLVPQYESRQFHTFKGKRLHYLRRSTWEKTFIMSMIACEKDLSEDLEPVLKAQRELRFQGEYAVPPGFRIFVKNLIGNKIVSTLRVQYADPVSALKMRLMGVVDIPVSDLRLVVPTGELLDKDMLFEYRDHVYPESTLYVSKVFEGGWLPSGGCIYVAIKGVTHRFRVYDYSTIEFIKNRIQDSTKILLEEQTLIYDGQRLENELTLDCYNIRPNSTLQLVVNNLPILSAVRVQDNNSKNGRQETLLMTKQERCSLYVHKRQPIDWMQWAEAQLQFRRAVSDQSSSPGSSTSSTEDSSVTNQVMAVIEDFVIELKLNSTYAFPSSQSSSSSSSPIMDKMKSEV